MHEANKPQRWMTLAAFAVIYFVWGSTFLAIRVGVHEVPPFLFAAMRFLTAGLLLYLFLLVRGERSPTLRQWISASLLGLIVFVFDYGILFWAEQRVPSGIAAVMLATIPAFTALSEIVLLRTQRLTIRLALALIVGLAGVAVLMGHSMGLGEAAIDTRAAIALVFGALSWSVASSLTKIMPLPESKVMSSASQMLVGGILLSIISIVIGDFRGFHPAAVSTEAWIALLYLIVAGSILGFTAYIWLLHHQSPTLVGTYAYVNPIVAVVLGYFLADEPLGPRTIVGTILILISVVVITTTRTRSIESRPQISGTAI
jgi:drug/metabolite transporter (DMT)-like permease